MENRVLKDYDVVIHVKFSFSIIQYCGLFDGTTKLDLGKLELNQGNSFRDEFLSLCCHIYSMYFYENKEIIN